MVVKIIMSYNGKDEKRIKMINEIRKNGGYRRRLVNHMFVLLKEIEILKERFQPTDTGHLRGAVSVLEERIEELKEELSQD